MSGKKPPVFKRGDIPPTSWAELYAPGMTASHVMQLAGSDAGSDDTLRAFLWRQARTIWSVEKLAGVDFAAMTRALRRAANDEHAVRQAQYNGRRT